MKRKVLVALNIVIVIALCTVSLFLFREYSTKQLKASIGIDAVKAMYDFGTLEQLDANMAKLKAITTNEVFNQLTIDNKNRTLNTYLKFKGEAVTVCIEKSTSDYVIYSLETVNIEKSRNFIFMFNVGQDSRIDWVREAELIDFV